MLKIKMSVVTATPVEIVEPVEVVTSQEGLPVLVMEAGNGEKFYVCPFRGYAFQVSSNIEFHGNRGSSVVFGMGNLCRLHTDHNLDAVARELPASLTASNIGPLTSKNGIKSILKAFFMEAIKDFDFYTVKQDCYVVRIADKEIVNDFLEQVYKMISSYWEEAGASLSKKEIK